MAPPELDRATLDANYNLRAAVPEHPTYFARYEAESRAFRQHARARLDLAYGDSPRQAVDLFLPQEPSPPLLVFIHGGYWQRFDRKDFSFVAAPLVAAGAAVALIGYDLAPAVDMDRIVAEIRQGIAWLHRQGAAAGLRSGADLPRRALRGRSSRRDGARDRLARALGLPADADQGRMRDQRRVRPRADPALLPERRAGAGSGAGAAQQPAAPAARARPARSRSPWARSRPPPSTSRAAPMRPSSRPRGWPCELIVQPAVDHFAIIMSMAEPERADRARDPRPDGARPGRQLDGGAKLLE